MNTKEIKSYAPEARREFIAAVTDRAALYGLSAEGTAPITQEGDVAIIGDAAFPKAVVAKRAKLAPLRGGVAPLAMAAAAAVLAMVFFL